MLIVDHPRLESSRTTKHVPLTSVPETPGQPGCPTEIPRIFTPSCASGNLASPLQTIAPRFTCWALVKTSTPFNFAPNPQTLKPSNPQTLKPSNPQTLQPSNPPTLQPSNPPTLQPSNPPTLQPSNPQTIKPSKPSNPQTLKPSNPQTLKPSTLNHQHHEFRPASLAHQLQILNPLFAVCGLDERNTVDVGCFGYGCAVTMERVVSCANCTPPKNGKSSATISNILASCTLGARKSKSWTKTFVETRAPASRQMRAAVLSKA